MQEEYFGFGSIENLEDILKDEGVKRVFLVSGKNSYEASGAKSKIEPIFKRVKCDFVRFSDFNQNPKLEEIQRGFELFCENKYDGIVAIGGGSAIDVAKAVKLFHYQKANTKIPLIAIPTTTGSGSEATYFIVYYIGKEKQSEGVLEITLPGYTICDPEFTLSLPEHIAASTGMDALSQAIEAYWSVNSNSTSKQWSEKAIRLLTNNLEKAVQGDRQARFNTMKAANFAGKAINIAKTTASHSVAYPITSYFGVLHGHAAALTLGQILVYNSHITNEDCNDSRGQEYVKQTIQELCGLMECETPEQARDKITRLMKSIGLKTKLSELGIDETGIDTVIEHGFHPARVKNNPRNLNAERLKEVLNSIA